MPGGVATTFPGASDGGGAPNDGSDGMMRFVAGVLLAAALVPAGEARAQERPDSVKLEPIIVSSTRTGRRIEDEPVRVEVVVREEIEEKLLMTPGDIAMLLNETGGVRIQTTAPALGGAAVRIQGLRGRYAQVLSDGLPLYGEATGLGPLQIPPMDLAQVEVIKGAASALYGAAALGGVINLISRRPDGENEVLLNATTRGGFDGVTFLSSAEDAPVRYTVMAGAHEQQRQDVSDDGWADIPSYSRFTLRPRLFVGDERTPLMITAGVTREERAGGASFERLGLETTRVDAGVVGGAWLGALRASVRGSAMQQRHGHRFGARTEDDRHRALFAEGALSGMSGAHSWLVGAALHHDAYRSRDVDGFDESTTTPGVFVQDEWLAADWLSLSASARADAPSGHGVLLSPRLSLLLRPGEWIMRVAAGGGHHVPTQWIEEIDATGLGALARSSELDVERARSLSVDVGRAFGEIEVNVTGFASIIEDAVALRDAETGAPYVANVAGETRTRGAELLARAHVEPVHATLSYTYVHATEPQPDRGGRREVALTPRHSAGAVVAWEWEGQGRIGAEAYYTGRQALHDNPYRRTSTPYVVFGMLAERAFGDVRVFVNFENIGDVRQTRHDPFLLPQRAPDGRLTTEAWGPLDGRVINAGVRYSF